MQAVGSIVNSSGMKARLCRATRKTAKPIPTPRPTLTHPYNTISTTSPGATTSPFGRESEPIWPQLLSPTTTKNVRQMSVVALPRRGELPIVLAIHLRNRTSLRWRGGGPRLGRPRSSAARIRLARWTWRTAQKPPPVHRSAPRAPSCSNSFAVWRTYASGEAPTADGADADPESENLKAGEVTPEKTMKTGAGLLAGNVREVGPS
jgi:hypothetical protein